MVFRSTPTCRAIALTDRPWRCRSRIMTRSPSLITRSPLPPAGGASGIRCSRRSSRASPGRSAVTKTGEISDDTSGENTRATHIGSVYQPKMDAHRVCCIVRTESEGIVAKVLTGLDVILVPVGPIEFDLFAFIRDRV